MPEFWRKVAILYSGGDDFAVYGAWDALIPLAREIHRLFHRFSDQSLKEFPGPEGKTLSASLALAPDVSAPLASVYETAGLGLDIAKSSGRDCFHLLGRTLEWKYVADAAELKEMMARLVTEYGCSPQFLGELAAFYRDSARTPDARGRLRERENRFEKRWRLHRRLSRLLTSTRDREFQRLRENLVSELIGKGTAQWRLRPAGRVALEWARLLVGTESGTTT
jgi:CRISPR-associated protein Csm1